MKWTASVLGGKQKNAASPLFGSPSFTKQGHWLSNSSLRWAKAKLLNVVARKCVGIHHWMFFSLVKKMNVSHLRKDYTVHVKFSSMQSNKTEYKCLKHQTLSNMQSNNLPSNLLSRWMFSLVKQYTGKFSGDGFCLNFQIRFSLDEVKQKSTSSSYRNPQEFLFQVRDLIDWNSCRTTLSKGSL